MKLLELSNDARSFLKDLPGKQYKQIASRIFELPRDPYPHDAKHVKGSPGYRRVDVGEYRIAYKVEGDVIHVRYIGKRNDDEIYRAMNR